MPERPVSSSLAPFKKNKVESQVLESSAADLLRSNSSNPPHPNRKKEKLGGLQAK
jgi:hypothetical protein